MQIAVIDCGTNTFHLIIARVDKKSVEKILVRTVAVKLGESAFTDKLINPSAFQRGIETLQQFSHLIREHQVKNIFAFATAAVRMAKNGEEFIRTVYKETGIKIESISGDEEAELIYYGVKHAVPLTEEKSVIMDIGGGSTEFIICNKHEIFWRQSFDLGASLLLEKLKPSDPISDKDIALMNDFFTRILTPLFLQLSEYKPQTLIGSSGSFDTFAELIGWKFYNVDILKDKIDYDFVMKEYNTIHKLLMNSTRQEREKMKGMIPLRADMIVVASVLLTFVLKKSGIQKMKWSDYALKEGILFNILQSPAS